MSRDGSLSKKREQSNPMGSIDTTEDTATLGTEIATDTIPICPAEIQDDPKAVDIHIDDERNPFHGSSSQEVPSMDSTGGPLPTSTVPDRGANAPLAETSIWFAPARAALELLVPYDANSASIGCVHFVEQGKYATLQDEAGSSQASVTKSTKALEASSTSSQEVLSPPAHAASVVVPSATEQDYIDALPHPDAIFRAADLEWQVLVSAPQNAPADVEVPSPCEHDTSLHLWRRLGTCDGDTFPLDVRISDVALGSDDTQSRWNRWASSQGHSVFSSQTKAIPSIVSKHLLTTLLETRTKEPRVGVSGDVHFQEAIITLIRIVGNAANGETRGLSTTSKLIRTKLGLDETSIKILEELGFALKSLPGDSAQQWFPPKITVENWKKKLLRATTELILWYEYQCESRWFVSPLSIEAQWTTTRYLPRRRNCTAYIQSMFGFQANQIDSVLAQTMTSGTKEALDLLGASVGSSDSVVDYCYLVNSAVSIGQSRQQLFHALAHIVDYSAYRNSDLLETRMAIEKSKGLSTFEELKAAYRDLEIDVDNYQQACTIQDDTIADLFLGIANASAADLAKVRRLKESLTIISKSRGKPALLERAVDRHFELDIRKAYEILEINEDTEDDYIEATFEINLPSSRKEECIEALRVIAENRNSADLRRLYRKQAGQQDVWEAPPPDLPAGLNNIGNTCYLNSVLQYFFAIKPLRDRVLDSGRSSSNAIVELVGVQPTEQKVTQKERERSTRFVEELAQLFSAMVSSPVAAVTPERDLAYLALVSSRWESDDMRMSEQAANADQGQEQALQATPLVEEPQQIETKDTKRIDQSTTVDELPVSGIESRDASHGSAATTTPPPLPPRPLDDTARQMTDIGHRRNSLMQLGAQQDVSECLDNVMSQIEVALTVQPQNAQAAELVKSSEAGDDDTNWVPEGDLLRRLFLGRTCQRVEVEEVAEERGPSVHIKREVFKTLPIDVLEEGRDIYDGLDGFFDEEMLEGPGGRPMLRTVTLTDAPAILQIQLQRVQYDRIRGVFKSQADLGMSEVLYMDRYLDFDPNDDGDAERLNKRKRSREIRRLGAKLRARLKTLRPAADIAASRTLMRTGDALVSLRNAKRPHIELQDAREKAAEEVSSANLQSSSLAALDGLDDSLGSFLNTEGKRINEEIAAIEKQIADLKQEVEALWADEHRVEYMLASVFMHRGEASHGHYFLNQRKMSVTSDHQAGKDDAASPSWYKYNDNVVQPVTLAQVLRDTTGATPYLVSFVRKDMQANIGIFDTICRMIDDGVGSSNSNNKILSDHVPPEHSAEEAAGSADDEVSKGRDVDMGKVPSVQDKAVLDETPSNPNDDAMELSA